MCYNLPKSIQNLRYSTQFCSKMHYIYEETLIGKEQVYTNLNAKFYVEDFLEAKLLFTKMHSSRMRTTRSSSWGRGLPQCMLGYPSPLGVGLETPLPQV